MTPERKQIRLRNYDYSSNGWYFITICTSNKTCYFGHISSNKMHYSSIGLLALKYWIEIPKHYPYVKLGKYVIMPNHVHGIIGIFKERNDKHHSSSINTSLSPSRGSISRIIGSYKSSVSRWCNKNGHDYFGWHYRFHDHIIRNSQDYQRIHEYILNNVKRWNGDRFYRP